jgi:signal transduction histidine kinase
MSRSMKPSARGNRQIPDLESASWPKRRSTRDGATSRAFAADAQSPTLVEAPNGRHQPGPARRPERTTRDGLVEALTTMSGRCLALKAQNRDLASEVKRLRAERQQLRSRSAARNSQRAPASLATRPRTFLAGEDERRQMERDLHDGVQNELVALIVKLTLAEQDRSTPPALAGALSELIARAQAALDSVREIAHGIYPSTLGAFGVLEALRAQARRAPLELSLERTAPRSTEQAQVAVYFSCTEALQNIAKHAGRDARVTLRCQHDHETLAVRIADNGDGFDPTRTPEGAGLKNIRDRIQTLGGTVKLTSKPRRGTVLTLSLPWPPRQPNSAPDRAASAAVATLS